MEHMHSHGGLIDHLLEEPLEGLLNSIGLAEKLNHFIVHALMDFLEISLLLLIVVTLVTYLQTYFPFDKMRRKLQKLRGLPGMLLALVLGALSPFCSCTIIPILMGFLAAGVPLSCFLPEHHGAFDNFRDLRPEICACLHSFRPGDLHSERDAALRNAQRPFCAAG